MANTDIVSQARRADNSSARQLQPVAQNSFRVLGLAGGASRREIYEAAARLRRAHKLGVAHATALDAPWLGAVKRSEADVREALGRLADPATRARERLYWFYEGESIIPTLTPDGLAPRVESLINKGTPAALHDAALLSFAAALNFDPELRDAALWARALALWKQLAEHEGFWSLLVAADLKGDFEQLATHGEARELRRRAARLAGEHLAFAGRERAARGDARAVRRALSLLRGAALPTPLLTEYENDIFAPAEENLDTVLNETFCRLKLYDDYLRGPDKVKMCDETLDNFNEKARPALYKFWGLTGGRGPASRRVFESAAALLNRLAVAYQDVGERAMALRTARKAWALAPPDSPALYEIVNTLSTVEDSAEKHPTEGETRDKYFELKTEEEYFKRLGEELRPLPKLFAAYPTEPSKARRLLSLGSGGDLQAALGGYPPVVVLLMLFVGGFLGWYGSSRSRGPVSPYAPLPAIKFEVPPTKLDIPVYDTKKLEELGRELEKRMQRLDELERRRQPQRTNTTPPKRRRRAAQNTNSR